MSVATPTILSEGREIDPTYEIVVIDVVRELNRIPYAELTLSDGDVASQTYSISNDTVFEPGKIISIKLRYEGETDDVTVFEGIVVKHIVSADANCSTLTLELKDETVKTTLVRKSVVFQKMTDDAVISQIITDHKLQMGIIASTAPAHEELVQYSCTDWDFMLSRAEANGLVIAVQNGSISASSILLEEVTTHRFEYGIDEIFDFEIELDAEHQLSGVEVRTWDIAAQRPTDSREATSFVLNQGNLSATDMSKRFGLETPNQLTAMVPLAPEESQAWADGRLMRSRLSFIRGRVCGAGNGDIALLDMIEINGIGDRFNGTTVVSGVRHRFDEYGWQTDVQFGLPATLFAERRDLNDLAAGGLLPAVSGLQIGVVGGYEEDPLGELRVKVLLPGINSETALVWARLASPEAGPGRGFCFRPEPGDEVVIGFFNDDPRQAVILGALFSSVNPPPESMSERFDTNANKGIVTKSGLVLQFVDDENASLILQTPAKNRIFLSDDDELIELHDQHGNCVRLSAEGVEIISVSNLKIEASGNVEIVGKQIDLS